MPGLPESNAKSVLHDLNSDAIFLALPLTPTLCFGQWPGRCWSCHAPGSCCLDEATSTLGTSLHSKHLKAAKSLQSGNASNSNKHATRVFGDQETSVVLRNAKKSSRNTQNRLSETAQTPGLSPNRLPGLDPAERWGSPVPWQISPRPTPLEPNFW